MDIVSHGLWAGAAAETLRRRGGGTRSQVVLAVALGVLPDIAQLLPVAVWALHSGDPVLVRDFVAATPGSEPAMPAGVRALSHHLHCIFHSLPIALVAGLLAWRAKWGSWIPLTGWWLHVVLDVPTHSLDYYAVPFLYPFTYWAFDGVPWTNPWVLGVNYVALVATYGWLWRGRP